MKMRNATIVKIVAIMIANLFLASSMQGSANPVIDELIMESAQTHDTHSYSYYKNQTSTFKFSADRTVEFTVYDDSTKNPASLVNLTVIWTSDGIFHENVVNGALTGAALGLAIAGCILAIIFTAGAATPAVAPIAGALIGGAIIGGIIGGVIAVTNKNIREKIHVITDEDGKVRLTKNWQVDVTIEIQLDIETEISKYSDFQPEGQPRWQPYNVDENKISKGLMTVDIYLVNVESQGGYLDNLRIAQRKVQNLTYVNTTDDGGYVEGTHFKPINMHEQENVNTYSEECNKPEWKQANFWNARTTVYPDGKGGSILWIESKRLIYIKDLTTVGDFSINVTYRDSTGTVLRQGAPAGAFELNDASKKLGLDVGEYWYYQWIWVVGAADITVEDPTITIEAYINIDGTIQSDPDAGIETIEIPNPSHIITFTFSDTSLANNVHHTVYAETNIPTVHGDIRYNMYSDGDEVEVRALGIQSLPSEWDTGTSEGVIDLFYDTCTYDYYFAIENEDGDEVFRSASEELDFNNETMTAFTSDIDLTNITCETSYRLTINNAYYGATMSSTLFFQLTDFDTHQNLSELVEAMIRETFKVTGAGEYGNFDNYHINQLTARFAEMDAKIQVQQDRLNQFIDDNGESNYTSLCQEKINYFNFFLDEYEKFASRTATDIAEKPADFTRFRSLCNALLMTYTLTYLYYSASIAYVNGDMELVNEIMSMTAQWEKLVDGFYTTIIPPPTWDLTFWIILLISLIIAVIITVAVARWYDKTQGGWKSHDQKKLAIAFIGMFAGVFALSFFIMYVFFYGQFYEWFGHVPTGGR